MRSKTQSRRRGASFLEVQVAAVVMGIAISGLAPLMVLNIRQASSFRERIPSTPIYLAPADKWRAKLGGAATVNDSQVFPAPEQMIFDDGSGPFTTIGSPWYNYVGWSNAYDSDFRLFWHHTLGSCEYTMPVTPGVYQVYVTYPIYLFLSTDVRYRVFDGTTFRGVTSIDQTNAHTDLTSEGLQWSLLGAYTCESGTLRVQVRNHQFLWAMADAIQVVPVLNTVELNYIDKDRIAGTVTAEVTVTP